MVKLAEICALRLGYIKMNRYDKKLYNIMRKYGLMRFVVPRHIPYLLLRKRINSFLEEFCNKFAGKSVTVLTDKLGKEYFKNNLRNAHIVCFDDMDCYKITISELMEYLRSCDVGLQKGDTLICALPAFENTVIKSKMFSLKVESRVIDLYRCMERNGIYLCSTDLFLPRFTDLKTIKRNVRQIIYYNETFSRIVRFFLHKTNKHRSDYDKFVDSFCARIEYEKHNKGGHYDDYTCERYVALLCEMKDFPTLFELLDNVKEYRPWINELRIEIENLMLELCKKVHERKSCAVVWNWVDNVGYGKVAEDMPWIEKQMGKSINFTNTFAVMPWTSWTFKALFSGKSVIRDKMFQYENVGEKRKGSYPIYDGLLDKGYKILYLGSKAYHQCMKQPEEDLCGIEELHSIFCHSSAKQWRALTLLAAEDVPMLLFVHNLYEPHGPFVTPTVSVIDKGENQRKQARKYMDQLLKFYAPYYDNCVRVYMSDHGDKVDKDNYIDEYSRVFFMIDKPGIEPREIEKMLSARNEMKVLIRILDGKDFDDLLEDKVFLESYDTYEKQHVTNTIEHIDERKKGSWMQYVGIRTKDEKYILMRDGEERYFLLPDEETNHASDLKYREKLDSYKRELSQYLIDPYEYDFFKESRRLYESIKADKSQ